MRVLLIGFGAFGLWFSRTMLALGHEVIAIERDEALVDRHADSATRAVHGDATDPAVLERAGARHVDAAVVGTSEDLSTTILSALALRDLGVKEIYAKVHSTSEVRVAEALDITEAIFPDKEAGDRLAHRITSKTVLEYTSLGPGFSLQEIAIPDGWVGKTLFELDARERGIQVVAVRDALTEELHLPPDPGERLKTSDALLVAGSDETLAALDGGED